MRQLNNLKSPLTSEANTMRKSKTSMRKLVLSGIVLACGMAGAVQAASLLASGPVFAGPAQQQVACEVVNAGSTPVTIVKHQLLGEFSGQLKLNFDGCGATLAPGAFCNFQANVNDQPGVAPHQEAFCEVVIIEPKTNVRGTMWAFDPKTGRPVSQTDLR
jgi:hypothetical protein